MKMRHQFSLLFIPLIIGCAFTDRLTAAGKACAAPLPEVTPAYASLDGIDCIPDISDVETARVVRVIDGDSVEVLLNGEEVQVRYIGINTPEYYSNQRPQAVTATQANENLVAGKTVYLFKDYSDTDKFGRLLRYVLTDETFVNLELVRGGYAEAKEYPPDTACHAVFENTGK